ncbi:MAG: hypothetical protein RMJ34_07450 [candidate division WOR-3 bacterium]|nr:hypothetical protein [candidate division WOR-3 bacterium]
MEREEIIKEIEEISRVLKMLIFKLDTLTIKIKEDKKEVRDESFENF